MRTRKTFSCLLSVACIVLLTSCASVKFFNDEELKNESGLRMYPPKPYVLVEYRNTKTESVRTTIVYLPDLSKPQYVKLKPGIGSSALKLELTNGILTSYGLTSDTKIPETLGKITDLITKSTSAINEVVRSKTDPANDEPVFELYEILITNGQTSLVRVK